MKTNEPTETELDEFNNWFETHFQTWLETKRQRGDYNETSSFRQSLKTSWFASRKCISAPSADMVPVPREEWEHILALARIMANHPRIHNDLFLGMECEAEPHLIALHKLGRLDALHKLGRLDALRSGEAGKEGAG